MPIGAWSKVLRNRRFHLSQIVARGDQVGDVGDRAHPAGNPRRRPPPVPRNGEPAPSSARVRYVEPAAVGSPAEIRPWLFPCARDRRGVRAAPTHRGHGQVRVRTCADIQDCCRSCFRPRPCGTRQPVRCRAVPWSRQRRPAQHRRIRRRRPARYPSRLDRLVSLSLVSRFPRHRAVYHRLTAYSVVYECPFRWRMHHTMQAKTANCVSIHEFPYDPTHA